MRSVFKTVAVIDVLPHENGAVLFDLAFQFSDLALDRALFLLQIRAHAGIYNRLLHMLPLIPEDDQRAESKTAMKNNPHNESSRLERNVVYFCTCRVEVSVQW